MGHVYLAGIEIDEFFGKISEIIDRKISASNAEKVKAFSREYISRTETAKLLKITLPTLAAWTKCGWLISHRIGRRVLYKRDEVETSIDNAPGYKRTRLRQV